MTMILLDNHNKPNTNFYSSGTILMNNLVSQLSTRLIFNQLKIVTVESCTGGWIGKVLTDEAGSSQWFAGGLITYTNQSKSQLVDVDPQLINKYGAVSLQVADAMALGVLKYFADCISVAVTGIAGPGGGTENKPVGTVCIAVGLNGKSNAKKFHFDGDREAIRKATIQQALQLVLDTLEV